MIQVFDSGHSSCDVTDDLLRSRFPSWQVGDDLTQAKDDDSGGDCEDIRKVVADNQDGDALLSEATDHVEYASGLRYS